MVRGIEEAVIICIRIIADSICRDGDSNNSSGCYNSGIRGVTVIILSIMVLPHEQCLHKLSYHAVANMYTRLVSHAVTYSTCSIHSIACMQTHTRTCTHAWSHANTHSCTDTRTPALKHTFIDACTHAHTHARTHARSHTHTTTRPTYTIQTHQHYRLPV